MKKIIPSFIAGVMVTVLMISSVTYATGNNNLIEVILNNINVAVNGEIVVEVGQNYETSSGEKVPYSILYKGTTYLPIQKVSEILGKEVKWDGTTKTANIKDLIENNSVQKDINKDENINNKDYQIHAYYAIKSYEQYKSMLTDSSLLDIDTVGFGWSNMVYNTESEQVILQTDKDGDFHIPEGYKEPYSIFKNSNKPSLLNIYADGRDLSDILKNKDKAIESIVSEIDNNKNGLNFDGVIINFEELESFDSELFNDFLVALKDKLSDMDKLLYVTVMPNTYGYGYDYRAIGDVADKVILMAHDYDVNTLSDQVTIKGIVKNPIAPYNLVENAILDIVDKEKGVQDPNKILLQISFGTSQWQVKDDYLYNGYQSGEIKADHPTYNMIYNRLKKEISEGKVASDVIFFENESKSPYIKYYNEDNQTDNYIWYEDQRSVSSKIDLVKKYNLGGISIWRIGAIPNYKDIDNNEIYLNLWNEAIKKIKE